jgi:poly(3-hydroxybutyrate) depolymerase
LRSHRYTRRPAASASAWQAELRRRLLALLRLEDLVDARLPLGVVVEGEEARDGYRRQHLNIASTSSRRVDVLVTLPDGDTVGLPAVVCLHGHGGDRFAVHDPESIYKGFAAALAADGYVTIAVDVGQHEIYESDRLLMGERLWDCIRCVDLLASHQRVDASRIGCAGLSLGGEMAMWLGAMDTRIASEVSAGFLATMDQMEHNHCLCWKFDGLRELVDYADIYALTGPRPLMCQNGLQEPETQFHVPLARQALAEVEPAYGDLGNPTGVCLHVHGGGHEIDLPALRGFFASYL